MRIYPAIDLMNGRCVRLTEGRFEECTHYADDPLQVVASYQSEGSEHLHVVDLDGARKGEAVQIELIEQIVRATKMKVQVGGGLRSESSVRGLLDAGAERVVIGSLAYRDPSLFAQIVRSCGPASITLALDFRNGSQGQPKILSHGWQENTELDLFSAITPFLEMGLSRFLCTDVSKDGKLQGVNLDFYKDFQERFPKVEVLASGGVSSLKDLAELRAMKIFGTVVGKALYEKRFSLSQALSENSPC